LRAAPAPDARDAGDEGLREAMVREIGFAEDALHGLYLARRGHL